VRRRDGIDLHDAMAVKQFDPVAVEHGRVAAFSNSAARATSGVRSKPKASSISPPLPFRA
jgi:hypothetical protein